MALIMPPKTPNIAINSTLSAFFTRNSCKWKEITIPKDITHNEILIVDKSCGSISISPNASYSCFAVKISDSS